MIKDEFMSNQVKKVLDYLGRLETKHLRDTDPDRRGRNSGIKGALYPDTGSPRSKNQT